MKRLENQYPIIVLITLSGNDAIVGMMLESHLHEGKQKLSGDPCSLQYGVSITDACMSWEMTERLILSAV